MVKPAKDILDVKRYYDMVIMWVVSGFIFLKFGLLGLVAGDGRLIDWILCLITFLGCLATLGWIRVYADRLVFVRYCGLGNKTVYLDEIEHVVGGMPRDPSAREVRMGEYSDENAAGLVKIKLRGKKKPIRISSLTPGKSKQFARHVRLLCERGKSQRDG